VPSINLKPNPERLVEPGKFVFIKQLLVYCHFLFLTVVFFANVFLKKCKSVSCKLFMNKSRKIYSTLHLCSAAFMILALAWLTVSTPFVLASQQKEAKQHKMEKAASSPITDNEEESSNPLGNNTEEKVPCNTSISEEYIHSNYRTYFLVSVATQYHKCENADTYIAFHGELLVPPPNFS
jgi:hypothetical protein